MVTDLYVMDPLERVNPVEDTTFDFLLEGQARGVENLVCGIGDLENIGRHGFATARPAKVMRPQNPGDAHCEIGQPRRVAFDDMRAIWMRKDPPVDMNFLLATHLLDRYDPDKTLMMNRPESLRVASEKLWALFADELGPKTAVSAKSSVLLNFIQEHGRGVVKPIGLAGGAGIMAFSADDKNAKAAIDLLTDQGKTPAVVQEYLPDVRKGDKRVIFLAGKPIGAVLRVPLGDDHRSNMHVGGTVEQIDVDEVDHKIAEKIGPKLVELGLWFVGIDVIGGKLTEVNVTSPTGVQEIDRLDGRTGSDRMSAQVMDFVDATAPKTRPAS